MLHNRSDQMKILRRQSTHNFRFSKSFALPSVKRWAALQDLLKFVHSQWESRTGPAVTWLEGAESTAALDPLTAEWGAGPCVWLRPPQWCRLQNYQVRIYCSTHTGMWKVDNKSDLSKNQIFHTKIFLWLKWRHSYEYY